ncbi:MAG: hypothetical protein HYT37_03260 [Candidatus Sungbacteria bacterium]|nr:hypothetical protein [Candidatus Sungbacteria bacterium]
MQYEAEPKTLVVVYDWCIPLRQFQKIIPPRVEFAKHIFACLAIKQDLLRINDYAFFAHVADVYCVKYPNCRIVIITQDQSFSDEVERHKAYKDGTVEVVTIIPCNSEIMNNKRAEEVAGMLIKKYAAKKAEAAV